MSKLGTYLHSGCQFPDLTCLHEIRSKDYASVNPFFLYIVQVYPRAALYSLIGEGDKHFYAISLPYCGQEATSTGAAVKKEMQRLQSNRADAKLDVKVKPKSFLELLRPEDYDVPPRYVPPPYPKKKRVPDPSDPSKTITQYYYESDEKAVTPETGEVKFGDKMRLKEEPPSYESSPGTETYYSESGCRKYEDGFDDPSAMDELFLEEKPIDRKPSRYTYDRYDEMYYSGPVRDYDYRHCSTMPPTYSTPESSWERFEPGFSSFSPVSYPSTSSYTPRSYRSKNPTWDVNFHDYNLPAPPPPPSSIREAEMHYLSIPLPPTPR
ncbi:unnamed protein product [Cylicocyclus nassatus]|uniref:Uncharacterized protein n=1 Tax=Cylicocyclus nassatus TaxID=53992 RepID=A0AA36DNI7_CYLNA|nr:unnamed protein product [Cylicocyclus nassatus]